MTISDLNQPDHPIIYASDPFYELTGFSRDEVLGKNLLFLQAPLSQRNLQGVPITDNDLAGIQTLQQAMHKGFECQLQISSFKKSGQRFTNVISIIPVYIPETGANYAVGLNVEDI
jgi:PAS domain-containing protein